MLGWSSWERRETSRMAEAGRPGSKEEVVDDDDDEMATSARRRLSEMTSPVRRSRAWRVFFVFF